MKRLPLLILFVLLVAGVGVFVWKSSRDARADTFLLADGSQLTFRAITIGTNHSYCFGNPFQRVAARIPGQFGVKWSGNTLSKAFPSVSTNAVFWFLVRKNPSLERFLDFQPANDGSAIALFLFKLKDDQGKDVAGRLFRTHRRMPSGDVSVCVFSTNLPPSSRTVHLWLHVWREPADYINSTEFVAYNPLYRKEP